MLLFVGVKSEVESVRWKRVSDNRVSDQRVSDKTLVFMAYWLGLKNKFR